MLRTAHRLSLLMLVVVLLAPAVRAELSPIEQLGKLIFFDTNLSTPPGQSCAACHDPSVGFTGPVSEINAHGAVYPGAVHTRFGNRKPPASAYVSFSPDFYYDETEGMYIGGMFWDGRARNTVEQAKGPFLNPLEQNIPGKKQFINKVRHSSYSMLFQEVFGWGIFFDIEAAYHHAAEAVAAYEASEEVNQFSSKYDYYLAGQVALTPQEMRGLELFEGQAMCAACHPSRPAPDGTPPLFTDYTYDNLGAPKNLENPFYDMPPHWNPDGDAWIDLGLGGFLGLPEEMGKFKVPTLRNVARSPYPGFVHAYMHNGVFKSLREVVNFYNTREVASWPPPEYPENVNHDELGNLGLTDEDVDAIVAFMETLSDGYIPEGTPPLRLQVTGGPIANTSVRGSEIRFVLHQPAEMALRIFDVNGRMIRTLLDGQPFGSGASSVRWDGTAGSGSRVPSGVYFYQLQAGPQTETHRLVWLR